MFVCLSVWAVTGRIFQALPTQTDIVAFIYKIGPIKYLVELNLVMLESFNYI